MYAKPLSPDHPDYDIVEPIVEAIVAALGSWDSFQKQIPPLFRLAIDEVIDAPRTGRLILDEIEKTEKTYLGTKIEIILRDCLGFPYGKVLDFLINGVECDVKHTMGRAWSIPLESIGRPAILLRENEKSALCDFSVILIRPEYMNSGKNRDRKGTISSANIAHVWWLLKDHPYPENIWQMMPAVTRDLVLSAGKGKRRIASLFENLLERPIPRSAIEALANQRDPLKRIRRNGGARDILAPKGIAILFGKSDKELIAQLGLAELNAEEFISFRPKTSLHRELLKHHGHID